MKTLIPLTLEHSNALSFHNLAIFLCHLFIDGKFRIAHVAHDSAAFDIDFLTQIETVCSEPTPWSITDVTQPFKLSWNYKFRTDSILQLIFFNPNHLTEDIKRIEKYFTFYRVFIFAASDEDQTKRIFSLIKELSPGFSASTLILHYNTTNGSTFLNWLPINDYDYGEWRPREIILDPNVNSNQNRKTDFVFGTSLFDRTFGEYERKRTIAINAQRATMDLIKNKLDYEVIYYHFNLNQSYINYTYVNPLTRIPTTNMMLEVKNRSMEKYKELNANVENISSENAVKLRANHPYGLHFNSITLNSAYRKGTKVYALYPYHTTELKVLFVYGADYKPEMDLFPIPTKTKILLALILLLVILATVLLRFIRQKFNLPRGDFVSSFTDCIIPMIGGGNLAMQHKMERLFFGVYFIGAFFIMAMFSGDIIDSVVRVSYKKINYLDQLTELNPPFFIDGYVLEHGHLIHEIIRGKIGPNATRLVKLPDDKPEVSFIYIAGQLVELKSAIFKKKFHLDNHILKESLGEVPAPYYLESDQYIPDRMLRMINEITITMLEKGMQEFGESRQSFSNSRIIQHLLGDEEENDDLQPMIIEQLIRVIALALFLFGSATAVFIGEIIVFRWKKWLDRKIRVWLKQYRDTLEQNKQTQRSTLHLQQRPDQNDQRPKVCQSTTM